MNKEDRIKRSKDYGELLARSVEYRKCFEKEWNEFYDLYRHRHPQQGSAPHNSYQVNKIFSTVNIILASHFIVEPHIATTPREQSDEGKAVVCEELTNYWWKRFKFQKPIRSATKDMIIIGHGWTKTTWRYEDSEFEIEPGEGEDTAGVPISTRPGDGRDHLDDDEKPEHYGVRYDQPIVERVSPYDMYIDPVARDFCELRWIAQRIWMTKDEVISRQKQSQKKGGWRDLDLEGGLRDEEGADRKDETQNDPRNWVKVIEFYDMERWEWCHFIEGGDEFLRDPSPMPYTFGQPFTFFGNHEDTEEFYPMGDVVAIADLQNELNSTRTELTHMRKRQRVKHWYNSKLGDEFKHVMTSNEDDLWAPIDLEEFDPSEAFGIMEQPKPDVDLYNQSALISADIDEVSGVSDYQRGRAVGTTATEAAITNASSQARASLKVSDLEEFMGDIAVKVIKLSQQLMTTKQPLRITEVDARYANAGSDHLIAGADGSTLYFKASREDINGEFDIMVEAGSIDPNNHAVRSQRAIQLVSLLGPFAQTGAVDIVGLVKYAAEQLGVRNVDKFINSGGQVDPSQSGGVGTPPGGPATDPQLATEGVSQQPGSNTQLQGQVGLQL